MNRNTASLIFALVLAFIGLAEPSWATYWGDSPTANPPRVGSVLNSYTASHTLTLSESVARYTGTAANGTFTLPSSPPNGKLYVLYNASASRKLTIDPGSKKIDDYDPGPINLPPVTGSASGNGVVLLFVNSTTGVGNWVILGSRTVGLVIGDGGSINFLSASSSTAKQVLTNGTFAQDTSWYLQDPGTGTVQLGSVDSGGAATKQTPVWNKGPGSGGYFTLNDDAITVTAGSTSGNFRSSMSEQATGHKKFLLYLDAVTDAGTVLTFPTAFSFVPVVSANSTGLTISTITASAITIPVSAASTGWIIVEGF